jgi:hypothetical protein
LDICLSGTMWNGQISSWVLYQLSPYDPYDRLYTSVFILSFFLYTIEFPTVLSFEQVQLELSSMKLWSLKDDKITRTYTARNFQVSWSSLYTNTSQPIFSSHQLFMFIFSRQWTLWCLLVE